MQGRFNRHVKSIRYLVDNFPIIALLGARQVGKTTLLKEIFPNSHFYDLEKLSDFEQINRDPEFFLNSLRDTGKQIVIDEAQISPPLFQALRVFVDSQREKNGQVIISGSSSPELLNHISESLAGRIAIYEVSTLSLREIEDQNGSSPFIDKIINPSINTKDFLEILSTPRIWNEDLWWGGYPEPRIRKDIFFKTIWAENYIQTYIDRDIRRLFPDLNMEMFRRFILLLSLSSGEIINQAQWAASLGVSEPTIKKYLDIVEGTYLFRKLLSYGNHPQKRMIKSPKGFIRDTGLCCALLKISSPEVLLHHPRAGLLFEVFCIEEILKNLKSKLISFESSFYHTRDHAEMDLILSFSQHKVPIEIKLGTQVRRESLKTMAEFININNLPFGIFINNGERPLALTENIFQIPYNYL